MNSLDFQMLNYSALSPEIILSVAGILLMLLIPFVKREKQAKLGYLSLVGIAAAMVAVIAQWGQSDLTFFDMVFQDNFANFAKLLFLFAVAAIIATSIQYLERDSLYKAEYFSLLLFATVGMCLMAASADLIMTFLGIEILSIATYVLAGYRLGEQKSTESAVKYFLLGAFSTGFLLYGIAFIYGATGSTKYLEIAQSLGNQTEYPVYLLIGLGLIFVGFGFKAALAPFHVWTPDVYEGAPIPITAHLAVASKAAALIALLRILFQVVPSISSGWVELLWISAVLTMLVGNIAALTQSNIKRMLAYSSIAHAGYLLVGLAANNDFGAQGVLFYLLAYAFMNLGAFAIIQIIGRQNEETVEIKDYAGVGFQHPFLGLALSVFLVSLAGIPLTAGFTGKLFLFSAAVQSGMYWLVVIAVIASAIGIYYYLRVLIYMYMRDAEGEIKPVDRLSMATRIVIVVMVLGTIYLGILPGSILKLASEAINF
ncbi:MAG: NADH-quinone oxidoreductase subunit N [Acidobacteriota bacterium]|nr:MAG: NADH-quinone oxidoreductase subunit N [Acidobacteriota bacterium]